MLQGKLNLYGFLSSHPVLELAGSAPDNLLPHPGGGAQLLAALCCLSEIQPSFNLDGKLGHLSQGDPLNPLLIAGTLDHLLHIDGGQVHLK